MLLCTCSLWSGRIEHTVLCTLLYTYLCHRNKHLVPHQEISIQYSGLEKPTGAGGLQYSLINFNPGRGGRIVMEVKYNKGWCAVWCQCTLRNPKRSKFPEPTTAVPNTQNFQCHLLVHCQRSALLSRVRSASRAS